MTNEQIGEIGERVRIDIGFDRRFILMVSEPYGDGVYVMATSNADDEELKVFADHARRMVKFYRQKSK